MRARTCPPAVCSCTSHTCPWTFASARRVSVQRTEHTQPLLTKASSSERVSGEAQKGSGWGQELSLQQVWASVGRGGSSPEQERCARRGSSALASEAQGRWGWHWGLTRGLGMNNCSLTNPGHRAAGSWPGPWSQGPDSLLQKPSKLLLEGVGLPKGFLPRRHS